MNNLARVGLLLGVLLFVYGIGFTGFHTGDSHFEVHSTRGAFSDVFKSGHYRSVGFYMMPLGLFIFILSCFYCKK